MAAVPLLRRAVAMLAMQLLAACRTTNRRRRSSSSTASRVPAQPAVTVAAPRERQATPWRRRMPAGRRSGLERVLCVR